MLMSSVHRLICAVALTLLAAAPAGAHHGFGDYDPARLVTLSGTVVRFARENPHSSLVLRVAGEQWYCVLPSALGLARRDIGPETFAAGQTVTVKGYLHKKDRLHMRPEWLVQDGRERSLRDARPPLPGETSEDWVGLGTKLHGGFGSYIALGVHIGLDALEHLGATPRTLEVTMQSGTAAPCACLADGLQLSTGATPGRGLLRIEPAAAPGVFGIVTITERTSGRAVRYTVPAAARELLDAWNKLPAGDRLAALRTVPGAELYARVDIRR